MHRSQQTQDTFDSLALLSNVSDDLSQVPSDLLHELPPSRRSKEFETTFLPCDHEVSCLTRQLSAKQLNPTKQKQLRALEHCIKLLISKERPKIKNTVGVWMTM
ncbi:hypothetical protein GUITHDRAFT_113934 [Guillardia theta CCMP2712]|uniref:Uncharacterized protein n=1 Tax=Guillardia theta (strain CCMP2712) TaxID=905079 RepID=L1IV21_GUITC|nr:hypothetical protein GUITHDRAFT_113934 [Guillardia theta CCMP2712]EKX39942.1 hypothetical protein GUITHDRAFT_113934 [Guillardia theta CCMP2712]|eukprot:XP_005826922.1 hypothetical protein GUITHDRAFT_113934 [Guillardia theta CCMP2712]